MQKNAFIYLIFGFLLIACSPQVTSNPASNDESIDNSTQTELLSSLGETVSNEEGEGEDSTSNIEDNETMNEANQEEENPIDPEETPAITQDNIEINPQEQKSEPVVVDLAQLMTPEPSEDVNPIEQPAPGIPDSTAKLLQDVRIDLSTQLSVDMDSIETVSVEEVMWRDSSLGCPVDGMAYLQVLTSGFRIILEVDGQTYHYHSKDTSNFILCQNPQSPIPGAEPAPGLGDT